MTTLKLVIQQLSQGVSIKSIVRTCNVSRNTIRTYKRKIKFLGLKYEQILSFSDSEIHSLLQYKHDVNFEERIRYQSLMNNISYFQSELKRIGVTRRLLWQEYHAKEPEGYSYSQFCEHLSKYLDRNDLTMVMQHLYGDCMEVDFAGKKLSYLDFNTGEIIEVPVLVCVLPASGYVYVEALPNAKQDQVYAALSRSLRYFGGVPKNILSDNMKQYSGLKK